MTAWQRLYAHKASCIAAILLCFILLCCFVGPMCGFVADPNQTDFASAMLPPSAQHWLGTDHLGRDQLARVLHGGRISLLVGLIATAISVLIGVSWGAVAGFCGGKLDALLMRIVDVLFALPFLVMVILMSLVLEQPCKELLAAFVSFSGAKSIDLAAYFSLLPIFFGLGALGWLTLARITRAQVMSVAGLEYVQAVRCMGYGPVYIVLRHILPNISGPIIVHATMAIPSMILTEAFLSFLGLGIKPPSSSWGTLIKEGADRMQAAEWMLIAPAAIFLLTLMSLNFLGDGLRDALDPQAN